MVSREWFTSNREVGNVKLTTFEDIKKKVPNGGCAVYDADNEGNSFKVKVYYLDGAFVVMSNHEGGNIWECEGGYMLNEFEDFIKDFEIKDKR